MLFLVTMQRSILGPLLALIYINDLSDGLTSNPNLLADHTSLFSVVQNKNSAVNNLNSEFLFSLMKIRDLGFSMKTKIKF